MYHRALHRTNARVHLLLQNFPQNQAESYLMLTSNLPYFSPSALSCFLNFPSPESSLPVKHVHNMSNDKCLFLSCWVFRCFVTQHYKLIQLEHMKHRRLTSHWWDQDWLHAWMAKLGMRWLRSQTRSSTRSSWSFHLFLYIIFLFVLPYEPFNLYMISRLLIFLLSIFNTSMNSVRASQAYSLYLLNTSSEFHLCCISFWLMYLLSRPDTS